LLNTLFGNRVDIAIARMKQFEPPEGYYLAFSGGKDSCVILDLAKRSGVKFDAHYNLTTVDPPEVVHFVRTFHEVQIHRPSLTMWELIVQKRMPPTRVVRYCCEWLKEGRGTGHHDRNRLVMTGVRAAESVKRSKRQMVEMCRSDSSKRYLHPIIDWSDVDVWEYIHGCGIRYCSLYDERRKRIGCVMCPMAGKDGMLRDAARWPKIADAYKRAFQRCVDKRIADGLPTEWRTGQEMFDWWINGGPGEKEDPDQMRFFFE